MRRSLSGNERGFSLVYALAAAGFLSAVVGGIVLLRERSETETYLDKIKARQVALVSAVLSQISQPSSLLASSAQSPALAACLGLAPGRCVTTESSAPQGAALVGFAANFAATGAPAARTGPTSYYDLSGMRCVGNTAGCPFEARAFFRATCPNRAANCTRATEIATRVVVVHRAGIPLRPSLATARLPDQPRKAGALDVAFTGTTFVSDILGGAHQACPEGSSQTGISPDGRILCKCEPQFRQTGMDSATGMPICLTETKCPAGTELRGSQGKNDPTPGQPICETPTYRCVTETGAANRLGRHDCREPKMAMRATSQNPFVGCIADYPSRKEHMRVENGSLSCPTVRVACCERMRD